MQVAELILLKKTSYAGYIVDPTETLAKRLWILAYAEN